MTDKTPTDAELNDTVHEAMRVINEHNKRLPIPPAAVALAMLALGTFMSRNSGYITKEDLIGQVTDFWDKTPPLQPKGEANEQDGPQQTA